MSDTRKADRLAGTTTAGSRFPSPACGASQRESRSQAAHDVP